MRKWLIVLVVTLTTMLIAAVSIIRFPHKIPLLWRIPYFDFETKFHEREGNLKNSAIKKSEQARNALNSLRKDCKTRYAILSGYRSPERNKKANGVSNSQHLRGIAFDVVVPRSNRAKFYECAKKQGFTAFGWSNRTVHIDMGPKRWWTYNEHSQHVSGKQRHKYLFKAPDNFKKDFGLLEKHSSSL